jgi:TetR/AcrR family transcriptional regulator, acrAB operon repressor
MNLQENRKKAQGIRTKTECVRAAVEVFARKGVHRAKLDDIAEAAGVTRGALYWHYRTKEAFLIAVLETLSAHWTRETVRDFPILEPADLLIARFFKRFARENRRAPWVNRFGMIVGLDAENIHPRLIAMAAETEATNRWLFTRMVEHGQRTGVFDRKLDAAEMGAVLASAHNAILASWYQDPEGYQLERFTDSLVSTLLRGMVSAGMAKQAPRVEQALIRKMDAEIDRFFKQRVSAFVYSVVLETAASTDEKRRKQNPTT